MILKISFYILLLALVNAKSVEPNQKTCKVLGLNGRFIYGGINSAILNAEERMPIKLNKNHGDKLQKMCYDFKNHDGPVCCDGEQLQEMFNKAADLEIDDKSCAQTLLNIKCKIFCNVNQNKYVNVLKKEDSYMKYYDDKKDANSIGVKVDLEFVDKFFKTCKDAKVGRHGNKKLNDLINRDKADEFMFELFNSEFWTHFDFRFHNTTTNKSVRLVKVSEQGYYLRYVVVDNSIELLPVDIVDSDRD